MFPSSYLAAFMHDHQDTAQLDIFSLSLVNKNAKSKEILTLGKENRASSKCLE